ncbi:MAG: SDR family oxidoreductase [Novosphingobium sp.]|nr:SDR family oxidoreductase [Novosphingobium sp.]
MAGGQIAVIAGGGSGIGQGTAIRLAGQGWRVVLVGRDADKLDRTIAYIAESGGVAESFPGDVRDWDRMAELGALMAPDGIDLLVNSAGGQFAKHAADLSRNGWKAVVETNLDGAFFLARHLHVALAKRRGSIVNLVANLWQKGAPTMAHSAAARAGVVNLTRTLAMEWAGEQVRVNAVSPGYIDTPALIDGFGALIDTVPLKRIGTVEEVFDAILYLASATYVTGEVLTIDGGLQLV